MREGTGEGRQRGILRDREQKREGREGYCMRKGAGEGRQGAVY